MKSCPLSFEDVVRLRQKSKPFITKLTGTPHFLYFAWVNAAGRAGHFVSCKDYVHEIFDYALKGQTYEGTTPDVVDREKVRIAIGLKRIEPGLSDAQEKAELKKADQYAYRALKFLNAIERSQNFEYTTLKFGGIHEDKGVYARGYRSVCWVYEGDKRWLHASPLVSFYLMAMRMGIDYDGKGWRKFMRAGTVKNSMRDRGYVDESNNFWEKLIGRKVEEVFGPDRDKNWPRDRNVGHGAGYRWMATNPYWETYPHWERL